jgi:hypothetical protein
MAVPWPDAAVGVEVPTAEGNGGGRGNQTVEGARGEVGKHHRADAKLTVAKAALEDGRSGLSAWRSSADDEEDGRLGGRDPHDGRCRVRDSGTARRRRGHTLATW